MNSSQPSTRRRFQPTLNSLESRCLLSIFAGNSSNYNYRANQAAQHDYDVFVSTLQRIELNSQATPAQYLALRDDSRALTEAVSTSGTTGNSTGVIAATLLIDRSLDARLALGPTVGTRSTTRVFSTDLAGFHVSPGTHQQDGAVSMIARRRVRRERRSRLLSGLQRRPCELRVGPWPGELALPRPPDLLYPAPSRLLPWLGDAKGSRSGRAHFRGEHGREARPGVGRSQSCVGTPRFSGLPGVLIRSAKSNQTADRRLDGTRLLKGRRVRHTLALFRMVAISSSL